jgi:type I restriction enzyme R subunit
MSQIGKPERATQNRVRALFCDELGYRYLGDWSDRPDNSNIEEKYLSESLSKRGYTAAQINRAIYQLRQEANNPNRSLYENNKKVYQLLRYGVPVKVEPSKPTETVHLIDWANPDQNDFAVVEEVTLRSGRERRPDLVLYLNGIAIAVIELKSSLVSIGDGIGQLLSNQQPEFNQGFFSTIQFVFAGNDTEGLRYGTIGTEAKYFLTWKEDVQDNTRYKLDKYLLKLCDKQRILELIYDFVLFDSGTKKLPRVHQYFAIKAAQATIAQDKGGIIWHTQGSGKSIVMVLLAKWILENNPHARVAIITDRDELDKQIERVFRDAGEQIKRTNSGRDLMNQLSQPSPRLLCSLIHKFGRRDIDDFNAYIKDLEAQPSPTVGDIFVFVDECHRTQSGKLHRAMKAIMPNAIFIGFTGTPLLKQDRATSLEVFGDYIHTYKYSEAVEDEVVLDLSYEARDIDQRLSSQAKVDAWFDIKTKGLNDWQKDKLKEHWGTMQKVLSSRSRMDIVVSDIILDFSIKPRLASQRGNAMLVASSIYDACKYFSLFQKTELKGKCALITSYNPNVQHITREETGANTETDQQFIYNTYNELLNTVSANPGQSKTETYEEHAKDLFVREPATMKLLIVVSKLLTGFDAPSCTYLYIDKSMRDHDLFQAICRTNRLDGEDKVAGYIIDYKDLFKHLENAITVYSSELDHSAGGVSPEVLIQDQLKKGRERLDLALEALALLCEPVAPPQGELEFIHYFCGNSEIATDLKDHEPQRVIFYQAVASLIRAFANIGDDLTAAGYSDNDINRIKSKLEYYIDLRETIRKASNEVLDLKPYEADMRHLIDTYIQADQSRAISAFDEVSVLDLIESAGIDAATSSLPEGVRKNKDAVAETIENNVRSKILKEHLQDPAYYDKMSELLAEIIAARKEKALEYEEYLKKVEELAKRVVAGQDDNTPEPLKRSPAIRAIYNNLIPSSQLQAGSDTIIAEEGVPYQVDTQAIVDLAVQIDAAVKRVRSDSWRGVQTRELIIKQALYAILQNETEVERIFLIIKAQKEY